MGVGWYNDNLRALGRWARHPISPQMVRDETNLETWQHRARRRPDHAGADRRARSTRTTATSKKSALDSQSQNLSTTTRSGMLVDEIYQSQLAPANGITVSRLGHRRALRAGDSSPSSVTLDAIDDRPDGGGRDQRPNDRRAPGCARQGQPGPRRPERGQGLRQVAQTYGTDAKSQAGGDLGRSPRSRVSDDTFGQAAVQAAAQRHDRRRSWRGRHISHRPRD